MDLYGEGIDGAFFCSEASENMWFNNSLLKKRNEISVYVDQTSS